MAKQKNQHNTESFTRRLVEITENPGAVAPEQVRALSDAYNVLIMAARRFARDNQSVTLRPSESAAGTYRTKTIDVTGENADKLVKALEHELDEAVSKKDRGLFSSALTVSSREQSYKTIRARLEEPFVKNIKERFMGTGAEVNQIGDNGMYEIAVPEGAMVRGAGKNHTRRVGAWSAMRIAVRKEQERALREREEERKFLTNNGIDPDAYERLNPRDKKIQLNMAAQIHKNRQIVQNKDLRRNLIGAEIERAGALSADLSAMVMNDPRIQLPEAQLRKLDVEARAYRSLTRRADDSEEKLEHPDEIRRARVADLKRRRMQREASDEYYNDPANINDPYVQDRLLRTRKARNREEKARLLELERTPGTPEYYQATMRKMAFGDADADEKENILKEYIKQNPKSRLAKQAKAAQKRKSAQLKRDLNRGVDRADKFVKSMLLRTLVGIATFVGLVATTSVRLLAAVLKIGDVVRENAANAQTYALTDDQMRRYTLIEKNLKLPEGTYAKLFGGIQGKLSNIEQGGLDQWIRGTALVSSRGKFGAIDEALAYAQHKPGSSVMTVLEAAFNDAFIASVNKQTGVFEAKSFSDALGTNAKALSGALPNIEQLINRLGEWFLKLSTSDAKAFNAIVTEAKAGGNPYALLEENIAGDEIKLQKEITPGELLTRSEEVAKTFDRVRTTFETIRDGVLQHILAAVEPLAGFLLQMLKVFLAFLNDFQIGKWKSPFHGKFTGAIIAMNEGFIAQNEQNRAENESFLHMRRPELQTIMENLGYKGQFAEDDLMRYYERFGELPIGYNGKSPTPEQAADLYVRLDKIRLREKMEEAFSEQAKILREEGLKSKSYLPVMSTSPLEISRLATGRLASTWHSLANEMEPIFEQTVREVGQGSVKQRLEEKAHAYNRIYGKNLKEIDDIPVSRGWERQEKEKDIKEAYKNYELYTAARILADQIMDDGVYAPGEIDIHGYQLYRKESEEMAVESTIMQHILRLLGVDTVVQHIRDDTLRVLIQTDDAKREFTIIVNDVSGRRLGVIKDVSNPIMKDIKIESNGYRPIVVDWQRWLNGIGSSEQRSAEDYRKSQERGSKTPPKQ